MSAGEAGKGMSKDGKEVGEAGEATSKVSKRIEREK